MASKFYVDYETARLFREEIDEKEYVTHSDLLRIIGSAKEFESIKVSFSSRSVFSCPSSPSPFVCVCRYMHVWQKILAHVCTASTRLSVYLLVRVYIYLHM